MTKEPFHTLLHTRAVMIAAQLAGLRNLMSNQREELYGVEYLIELIEGQAVDLSVALDSVYKEFWLSEVEFKRKLFNCDVISLEQIADNLRDLGLSKKTSGI